MDSYTNEREWVDEEVSRLAFDEVTDLLGGMELTVEQVKGELSTIPEVKQILKLHKREENLRKLIPKWAKDGNVTLSEWQANEVLVQSVKKVRRDRQARLDELALAYKRDIARVYDEYEKKMPVVAGGARRLLKASTMQWSDIPVISRARAVLQMKGKSEDEISVIKKDMLAAASSECLRLGDGSTAIT